MVFVPKFSIFYWTLLSVPVLFLYRLEQTYFTTPFYFSKDTRWGSNLVPSMSKYYINLKEGLRQDRVTRQTEKEVVPGGSKLMVKDNEK